LQRQAQGERPTAPFTREEVEAWIAGESKYENSRTLAMLRAYAAALAPPVERPRTEFTREEVERQVDHYYRWASMTNIALVEHVRGILRAYAVTLPAAPKRSA
jgi:hypothetical protein